MTIDTSLSKHDILGEKNDDFVIREAKIIKRIKKHYSNKLKRNVDDVEAREIAANLLAFAKVIYGVK